MDRVEVLYLLITVQDTRIQELEKALEDVKDISNSENENWRKIILIERIATEALKEERDERE